MSEEMLTILLMGGTTLLVVVVVLVALVKEKRRRRHHAAEERAVQAQSQREIRAWQVLQQSLEQARACPACQPVPPKPYLHGVRIIQEGSLKSAPLRVEANTVPRKPTP